MKKHRRITLSKPKKNATSQSHSFAYIGNVDPQEAPKPSISKMAYDAQTLEECSLDLGSISNQILNKNKTLWLNIHGVHNVDLVAKVGEKFGLHPLVIEDILNTEQRAKIEEFDDYLFLEARNFYFDTHSLEVSSEQISLILMQNCVLTFQERPTGAFEPVRERLRATKSQMRGLGADYLVYALLDSIVDRYFKVLDTVGEASETLEKNLLTKPSQSDLQRIHQLKHVSIELRRAAWPLREVLNTLIRNEKNFFSASTLPYLRDVYDHTVSFIEALESIRDGLIGMMDVYMASMSQRVNLELRALTVVTMLFMPATLITGIFGMNFERMPWLQHKNGFWYAMGLIAAIAFLMILIFWRRQWINRSTFSIRKTED